MYQIFDNKCVTANLCLACSDLVLKVKKTEKVKKVNKTNSTKMSLTITEVHKMIKLSFQIIFSMYPYFLLQNGLLSEIK